MFLKAVAAVVLGAIVLVEANISSQDECSSLPPVTVAITGYRNHSGHWISEVVVEGDKNMEGGGLAAWQGRGCHVDVQHRPFSCESGETSADVALTFTVPPYTEVNKPAYTFPPAPGGTDPSAPGATGLIPTSGNTGYPATRAIEPPTLKTPRIPPAGYLPLQGVGHYRFVAKGLSWTAARHECNNDGGDLANIDTPEKLTFVKSLGSGWTWIGLQERGTNNVYYTPSGEVWVQPTYLLWYPGQPNYKAGSDCVLLLMKDGRIGDTPCEPHKRYFLCEIPWY